MPVGALGAGPRDLVRGVVRGRLRPRRGDGRAAGLLRDEILHHEGAAALKLGTLEAKVSKLQALLRDKLAAAPDAPDPKKPIGARVKMLHGPPYSTTDVEADGAATEAQASKAAAMAAANAAAQLLAHDGDGEAEAVVVADAAANAAIALERAILSKSLAPGWPSSAPVIATPAEDEAPVRFSIDDRITYKDGSPGTVVSTPLGPPYWYKVKLDDQAEPRNARKSDLTLIPSTDADAASVEGEASVEGKASAEPAPEFGYIVDYRESDGMYRIVFDDIKDAEDANFWYKRGVDWYKRGDDFEVV